MNHTRSPLSRLTGIRPGETAIVLLAAAWFFCVLSAYYVIRPLREEMGVAGGIDRLPWLFTGTLVAMLLVHPLFAAMVARWPRRRFVAVTCRFFMVNLAIYFVLLTRLGDDGAAVWVGRSFFVWISVFNLFVVSVFWSFMTDICREDQGRRLFGLIGVGGTLGGIAGSTITAALSGALAPAALLWFSIALLECAVRCARSLDRRVGRPAAGARRPAKPLGGSALEGIRRVATSPYLLGICAFMLCYSIGASFLYFIQAEIMGRTFSEPAERVAVFASINLAVNTLTLVTQLFLTGRIMRWLGVGVTLAILPILSLGGFVALGTAPVLAVFVVFQVLQRAGNFALAGPAREVLYTVVPTRDKYKAKNFNDTFVYRAGDLTGAWSFAGLNALGLGISAIAFSMAPVAGVWLMVALWLGRVRGSGRKL